jgi:DNA invertase Pin-like site-specific DNA recombinase
MIKNMLLPVAGYVRMSTEAQHFSISNQEAAIEMYAQSHALDDILMTADAASEGEPPIR